MNLSGYEEYFVEIFQKEGILFQREKRFKDLNQGLFRFDFFLEEEQIIVEVDGEYHFKPIKGRRELMKQQEYDRRKNSYCLANNIPLYRIPYWDLDKIKNLNDILNPKYKVNTKWWNDEIWRKKSKR